MDVPKEQINLILDEKQIDRRIALILPEATVRRLFMLPIRVEGDLLYVATISPINLPGIDEIKLVTGLKVKAIVVAKPELERAIREQFSTEQTSKQAIADIAFQERVTAKTAIDIDDVPVIDLVNSIIRGAINDGASDIHLEPQVPEMRVRYRIDGVLHNVSTIPRYIEPAIISRIKLLADMDITEKRRPQDGHMTTFAGSKQVDLRISSVLISRGEKLVIRVLDKDSMLIDLEHLGLSSEQHAKFKSFIEHPYGMILVTGPTGSGKSTTLYAFLNKLDSSTQNIITVENPVEYQMTGISQMQVNPSVNLTFANALRTIVRQDPDIIMVGEIRDIETADVSVQAALTGHLVFSTLHTNDAPGAIVRLIDLEVQPFLIASAVIGVVAQRLVRKICPQCKEYYRPSEGELELLRASSDVKELARGKGCEHCRKTGYYGRSGIYEVFEVDDDVRRLIIAQASTSEIRKVALAKGMQSLSMMGRQKILQGVTTINEVKKAIHLAED